MSIPAEHPVDCGPESMAVVSGDVYKREKNFGVIGVIWSFTWKASSIFSSFYQK